jgi:hypothetical protein
LNNYNTIKELNTPKERNRSYNEIFNESEHGKFVNLEVDNLSVEELYEKFQIKKGATDEERVKELDMKIFHNIAQEVKQAEIKFYAFLNKEFNILNKKYLQCCLKCYDDPSVIICL